MGSAARGTRPEAPDQQTAQRCQGRQNLLLRRRFERVPHVPQTDPQPQEPGVGIRPLVVRFLRVVSHHRGGILAILKGELLREPRQRVHRIGRPVHDLDGQAAALLSRPEEDEDCGEDPNHTPLRGVRLPHDAAILREAPRPGKGVNGPTSAIIPLANSNSTQIQGLPAA